MGIKSHLFAQEICTESQNVCYEHADGGAEEVTVKQLDRLNHYVKLLGVPKRRNYNDADVIAGEVLFHKVNCQGCHVPTFTTAADKDFPELSQQLIAPYTDLLLHDMGPELADHRPEGSASGSEWRTAPLWGIGLLPTVNGHQRLLHDGRARGVEEVILWHGGEGEKSRLAFEKLTKVERQQVVSFVNSL